jgi:Holliday junction resolvase-like predicted endonuclease
MENIRSERTGVKHTNNKSENRRGDFAEFYAVTWLWDQGYEVFKNCGCDGPIDLIAVKDGNITLTDIKTRSNNGSNGTTARSEEQKLLGVQIIKFNPDNRKCEWVKHKT